MTTRETTSALKGGRGPNFNLSAARQRLNAFAAKLKKNSVAIFVANPERNRSNDTEFLFRQSSDILYLNGFPEPGSVLIVSNKGGKARSIMLVNPKDPVRETWTGIRQGVEGAVKNYHADKAFDNAELKRTVRKLVKKAKNVYYTSGIDPLVDGLLRKALKGKKVRDPRAIVHELRLTKQNDELALMRHAAQVTAEAHCEAMRRTRPGMMEYELQADLQHVFMAHGALGLAYNSIVGGGNNACVLHYTENDDQIRDGELILVDAGCEYQGYAADITRTWPANGKFSEPQREIYELVLAANMAGLELSAAGATLQQIHDAGKKVMEEGLVRLGILPKSKQAWKSFKARKKIRYAMPTITDFFMHGTSHWLGIDVHDVGSYVEGEVATGETRRKGVPKTRVLKPGMVFTIEPGLYFRADDERVPKKYRGIGVRIEDDVLITANGCEVLTAGVPKSVAEIEALMAGK